MQHVLIVEDSKATAGFLKKKLENQLGCTVHVAHDFKSGSQLIDSMNKHFLVAVLDLNLPDAKSGEIVSHARSKNIPSIVFTGETNDKTRKKILSKNVVDYVFKNAPHSLNQIVYLISRLQKNRNIKILVTDDSISSREYIAKKLSLHLYKVLKAKDGKHALNILSSNPDIMMTIIDFNMPGMDGFQLTKKIRKLYPNKEDMAILGISSLGDEMLSTGFLKNGANDFINKPFFIEELFCRVSQHIETIEAIRTFKSAASIDFMTNLFSRNHLFDTGRNLFSSVKAGQLSLSVAIMEIVNFHELNLEYGVSSGDKILKHFAILLKDSFVEQSDIVSRVGGKEFCVVLTNADQSTTENVFTDLYRTLSEESFPIKINKTIRIRINMGVSTNLTDSFDDLFEKAYLTMKESVKQPDNKPIFSSNLVVAR